MTTYAGMDGWLSLGGILTGTPVLAAQPSFGASVIEITGAGSTLTGIVAVGDTFTITGVDGPHVVAGSFYVCTGNKITAIALVTDIVTQPASGATLTFDSNAVGEVRLWNINAEVEFAEDTAMGDKWETRVAGMAKWSGSAECMLDYDDARQAELIDLIAAVTPTPDVNAVIFGTQDEDMWYAQAVLSNFAITEDKGDVVSVTFTFAGQGDMLPRWD